MTRIPTIVGVLADLLGADRVGLKADAIVGVDRSGTQLMEDDLQGRQLRRAKPEQVGIPRRAMGDVEPQVEEQGALEQEALGMPGAAQAIEEPLQGVTGQDQVEVLPLGLRLVEQASADGRGRILSLHVKPSR